MNMRYVDLALIPEITEPYWLASGSENSNVTEIFRNLGTILRIGNRNPGRNDRVSYGNTATLWANRFGGIIKGSGWESVRIWGWDWWTERRSQWLKSCHGVVGEVVEFEMKTNPNVDLVVESGNCGRRSMLSL